MYSIYKITNAVDGKVYVGKTKRFKKRWQTHLSKARCGETTYLCNAIRKHGEAAFSVLLLEGTEDNESASRLETFWIKFFDSTNANLGYNLTEGGEGSVGYIPTPETRAKLSAIGKARPPESYEAGAAKLRGRKRTFTPEHRSNLSKALTGKSRPPISEKHKASISIANRGARRTPETKGRISKAAKERYQNPEYRQKMAELQRGRKASEETRARMSAAHKGKPHSPEWVEKVAAANRGRKVSPEEYTRLCTMNLGRRHSDETKAKVSAAGRRRVYPPVSEEQKVKISAGLKQWYAKKREAAKTTVAKETSVATAATSDLQLALEV